MFLSERRIIEDKFRGFEMLRKKSLCTSELQHETFLKEARGNRVQYKGDKNVNYKPYFKNSLLSAEGECGIFLLYQKNRRMVIKRVHLSPPVS